MEIEKLSSLWLRGKEIRVYRDKWEIFFNFEDVDSALREGDIQNLYAFYEAHTKDVNAYFDAITDDGDRYTFSVISRKCFCFLLSEVRKTKLFLDILGVAIPAASRVSRMNMEAIAEKSKTGYYD